MDNLNPPKSSKVTPTVVSYAKPVAGRTRIAHQSKIKAEPLQSSLTESLKPDESVSASEVGSEKLPAKTFPNKKGQIQKKEEVPFGRRAKDRLEMKRLKDTTENFDKKEAALKIVESRRTENQNKNIEKPKTLVAPSNMPWVPNPHFLLPNNSISILSIEDHRRYVAIITNFTRMDKSLRFEYNNIELESMDAKLKPEREKFVSYVKEQFLTKGCYSAFFKGGIAFGLNRFKERLCTLSDAGYHSIVSEVEWKSNTRSIASRNMYVKKPVVLSLGKGKKLEMPDPSRRCVFEHDAEAISERYPTDYTSKFLRDDLQAIDFAAENDVTAILSSSAMRNLLTSHFPLRKYRRAFPLSIFRKFLNGSAQRVVCIGNHVPVTPPSKTDLMKTFAKYVVRNAMEKQERQKQERSFKGVRSLKRPPTKDADENIVQQKKIKVEIQEAEKEEEGNEKVVTESALMIDEEEENDEKEDVNSTINNDESMNVAESVDTVKQPLESAGDSILDRLLEVATRKSPAKEQKPIKAEVDVLDSILSHMEETPNVSNAPVTSNPYSYMVVPVDNDGGHKVLIRSRPHGRDIANTPISVTTKLQYIPQCGAEEPFMEEKIWNALTGALKDSTYQADIHLNIPEAHCLQLTQNRSVKMFETLPEEAKELLSGRWQRFYNLLEEIKELQEGEYLLVENEDEMLEIWTEAIAADDATWSRKKIEEKSLLVKSEAIHNEPIEFLSRFNGFALHTPLVWHIVKSRIPASFLPPNPNKNYNNQRGGRGGRRGGRRGGNFRGRGRGRGGGNRGNRGGGAADRKPVVYTDHDANPFELFDQ
uniref:Uncharacterized protein n=1 Tax=Panagrolaimus superbus TaxID=310955 RepID=A0A914YCG0_9BILA